MRALLLGLVAALPLSAAPASAAPDASGTRTIEVKRKKKPAAKKARRQPLSFDANVAASVIYLVGGKVHVGNGKIIEDAVIKIAGGRIESVGESGSAPGDATAVDLKGKIVTPGLIAADANIGLVEIRAESSTRDDVRKDPHPIHAGYDASSAVNSLSSLFQVNAIDGVTSAAVSPGGGLISGQVAWVDLVHGARDAVARPRVAIDAAIGQGYGGSRAATLAKLREVLSDARFYRQRKAAHDRRQSRDLAAHPLDLAALQPVLARRIPLTVSANRATDILALLEIAREFRIRIAILGGAQAWRVADELAKSDVVVIVQPTRNLPGSFDTIGARLDNAALLHRAGVRVGIAALGGAHNVRSVTQEAGIAVAYGLGHEAALQAVTLNIAEAYGMADHYGSIEAGKVANIAVWEEDPFELSSVPTQVYIRGKAVPMVSRQTLLRDRYMDLSSFR
jgi:imidazolonepropionase-like amidohydrolase